MAKQNKPSAVSTASTKISPIRTEIRNSPIPKVPTAKAAGAAGVITREAIALRAYYIWKTAGGSEFDNWLRAERELRAGK